MHSLQKSTASLLPSPLSEELVYFFQQHPPHSFSRQLRSLLLDHLHRTLLTEKGVPCYLQELLPALNHLMDILDTATDAQISEK